MSLLFFKMHKFFHFLSFQNRTIYYRIRFPMITISSILQSSLDSIITIISEQLLLLTKLQVQFKYCIFIMLKQKRKKKTKKKNMTSENLLNDFHWLIIFSFPFDSSSILFYLLKDAETHSLCKG